MNCGIDVLAMLEWIPNNKVTEIYVEHDLVDEDEVNENGAREHMMHSMVTIQMHKIMKNSLIGRN